MVRKSGRKLRRLKNVTWRKNLVHDGVINGWLDQTFWRITSNDDILLLGAVTSDWLGVRVSLRWIRGFLFRWVCGPLRLDMTTGWPALISAYVNESNNLLLHACVILTSNLSTTVNALYNARVFSVYIVGLWCVFFLHVNVSFWTRHILLLWRSLSDHLKLIRKQLLHLGQGLFASLLEKGRWILSLVLLRPATMSSHNLPLV